MGLIINTDFSVIIFISLGVRFDVVSSILSEFPLLEYASRFWHKHYHAGGSEDNQTAERVVPKRNEMN